MNFSKIKIAACSVLIGTGLAAQTTVSATYPFGGKENDLARRMIRLKDGNYLIAGRTNSSDGEFTGFHKWKKDYDRTYDGYLIKMDPAGKVLWARCYGGSREENILDVIELKDGNIAFVGNSNSAVGDVKGYKPSANSNYTLLNDLWAVKLDASGNMWSQCYGGTGEQSGTALAETGDGHLMITGFTRGGDKEADDDAKGYHKAGGKTTDNATKDIWLLNLSQADGKLNWQQCIGGTIDDEMNCIAPTSDGNFIGSGFASLNSVIPSASSKDPLGFIMKFNSKGEILKSMRIQNLQGGMVINIKENDQAYFVCGASRDQLDPNNSNKGHMDAFILKFNTGLDQMLWVKTYGGPDTEWLYDMQFSENGDITLCGGSAKNGGDISGVHEKKDKYDLYIYDVWLLRLNQNGEKVSSSIVGSKKDEIAFAMLQNGNKTILLVQTDNPAYSGKKKLLNGCVMVLE